MKVLFFTTDTTRVVHVQVYTRVNGQQCKSTLSTNKLEKCYIGVDHFFS